MISMISLSYRDCRWRNGYPESFWNPFGSDGINASEIVARKVAGTRSDLRVVELPTVFDDAFIPLMTEIERIEAEAIIACSVRRRKDDSNSREGGDKLEGIGDPADSNGYIARGERISISNRCLLFYAPSCGDNRLTSEEELPVSLSFTAGTFVYLLSSTERWSI